MLIDRSLFWKFLPQTDVQPTHIYSYCRTSFNWKSQSSFISEINQCHRSPAEITKTEVNLFFWLDKEVLQISKVNMF